MQVTALHLMVKLMSQDTWWECKLAAAHIDILALTGPRLKKVFMEASPSCDIKSTSATTSKKVEEGFRLARGAPY